MRRCCRALLLAAALMTAGCGGAPQPTVLEGRLLPDAVLSFVAAQQDDGREQYERPEPSQAQALATAVAALGAGDRGRAADLAQRVGYEVVELEGGALALVPAALPDERGWGLYVVQPGGLELAVEVPHPRADLDTERLGVELAQAVDARYLLVAGASRRAADGAADPSRADDGVFTAVHRALAAAGVPAVQLHGFAADSLPGTDLVLSPGAADLGPLAREIASAADRAGLEVCRAWQTTCGRLEGRRNVQGIASREEGAAFVHVEAVRSLREDDARAVLVGVLAEGIRA